MSSTWAYTEEDRGAQMKTEKRKYVDGHLQRARVHERHARSASDACRGSLGDGVQHAEVDGEEGVPTQEAVHHGTSRKPWEEWGGLAGSSWWAGYTESAGERWGALGSAG